MKGVQRTVSDFFKDLQMLAGSTTEIKESRKVLNELVAFCKALPYQEEQTQFFANLRKVKPETLKSLDGFFITEETPVSWIPEKFHHDSYGFVEGSRLIYSGRFVYPIKDIDGDVAGFTGYDKFEEPKYLDSKNYGYKAKQTMLYGMESIYDEDYIVVVEGPACRVYLKEVGINAASLLGSYMSPYVIEILKRFGRRCIIIPDADDAGNKLVAQCKRSLPCAQVLQSKIAKDVDDSRLVAGDTEVAEDIKSKIQNPFTRLKYFE